MTTTTINADLPESTATTAELAVGDTIITNVGFAGDFDWIHVRLKRGVTYVFTMTADNGTGIDASIFVHNAAGNTVQSVDNGTGLVEQIQFTAVGGALWQDFYLDVGDFNSSATGQYSISMIKMPPFGLNDVPGDATTTATLSTSTPVSSDIAADADQDWYRVDLVQGTTYTFNMTLNGVSNLHSHLVLHDANGNVLVDDFEGARDNASQLTFTATQTGTFFLDAGTFRDPGNYDLTMVEGSPFGPGDIAGDKNTTQTLHDGDVVTSDIAPFSGDDDEDWFAVHMKKGDTYFFSMSATDGSSLNSYLGVFNVNNKLLASVEKGHPDDPFGWIGGGIGDVQLAFTAPKPGTYYVAATTAINSTNLAGHSDGGYDLSMEVADTGSKNNDKMNGTANDDWLLGGKGNDLLKGLGGNDVLIGCEDNDTLRGGTGDDALVGDGVNWDFFGTWVVGSLKTGNDSLFGESGDDYLFYDRGDDLLNGGAGRDTAWFHFLNKGVKVDLSLKGWQNVPTGHVKLVGIENLVGTDKNDVLKGNDADNTFEGGEGNDVLIGGNGVDTAVFGDWLYGDSPVTVDLTNTGKQDTGYGMDILRGIENVFVYSISAAQVTGNDADNRIETGDGNDTLIGGKGRDFLDGGNFDDTLTGGEDGDVFHFGGTDPAVAYADFGHDTITDFEVGNLDELLDYSAFGAVQGDFTIDLAVGPGGTTRITYKASGAYVDLQNAFFASEADVWAQVTLV
ncbi:MAG: pre-peptidase C-terminal domain-containing protein [Hyphomicrobiaceae bacterium]|nr:pre-peptidase C-terminal domain-containing protein [Hyphomicrobiaceae bacterium]